MTKTRCRNVGELTVGGRVVGRIRCELDAGHDVETPAEHAFGVTWYPRVDPTPHRATLEWAIEGEGVNFIGWQWPEANDPDERFDVDPYDPR
jgi:hypothetical protein